MTRLWRIPACCMSDEVGELPIAVDQERISSVARKSDEQLGGLNNGTRGEPQTRSREAGAPHSAPERHEVGIS